MTDRSREPLAFLETFQLDVHCDPEQVRQAYLRLVNTAHPDHGGDSEHFRRLRHDYELAMQFAQRKPSPHFVLASPPHVLSTRRPRISRQTIIWLVVLTLGSVMTLAIGSPTVRMVCAVLLAIASMLIVPSLLSRVPPVVAGSLFLILGMGCCVFAVGILQNGAAEAFLLNLNHGLSYADLRFFSFVVYALALLAATGLGWLLAIANTH